MKQYKAMYYLGTVLSLLVGLWHFFVPWMFQWYRYIPQEYHNLIVGIDWTNFCFSLLLSGLSFILLIWGKKVFEKNTEAATLYGFLVFVWLFRVALTIIEPWPIEPIAWAAYTQLAGAILIMLLLLIPYIKIRFFKVKKP
jgi:hypothetical protein